MGISYSLCSAMDVARPASDRSSPGARVTMVARPERQNRRRKEIPSSFDKLGPRDGF